MPTAEINGLTIEYRDQGSGPAVVLIHAFPLNQTMWDDQVVALQRGFRLLTFDLPGFGGSPPWTGPATIDRMADVVQGLMAQRGIDRAGIVGLSMGGYISLALVRRHPGVVDRLVLADTRATADGPEARQNRDRMARRVEQEGLGPVADVMVPKLLGDLTRRTRPEVEARVRAMIGRASPQGVAQALHAMRDRPDSVPLLGQIRIPTLVVVGRDDSLTPPADAEAMHQAIASAELQVIEAAGHLSNLEQPELFNRVLGAFLTGGS